jgi:hypothetical protein
MRKVNLWAVLAAALLALVASSVYYTVLGPAWLELRGIDPSSVAGARPQIGEVLGQLARNLVVAGVLARFAVWLQIVEWKGMVRLALWAWLGLQAMAILGGVLHEGYPWPLYAIHVGDALMGTLLMAVVVGAWPARGSERGSARRATVPPRRMEDSR